MSNLCVCFWKVLFFFLLEFFEVLFSLVYVLFGGCGKKRKEMKV